jgi:hypothetical protein
MNQLINIILSRAFSVPEATPRYMLALLAELEAKANAIETGQDEDFVLAVQQVAEKLLR